MWLTHFGNDSCDFTIDRINLTKFKSIKVAGSTHEVIILCSINPSLLCELSAPFVYWKFFTLLSISVIPVQTKTTNSISIRQWHLFLNKFWIWFCKGIDDIKILHLSIIIYKCHKGMTIPTSFWLSFCNSVFA